MAKYVPIQQISMWRNLRKDLLDLQRKLVVVKEGLEAVRAQAAENRAEEGPVEAHRTPSTAFTGAGPGNGPGARARGGSTGPEPSDTSI